MKSNERTRRCVPAAILSIATLSFCASALGAGVSSPAQPLSIQRPVAPFGAGTVPSTATVELGSNLASIFNQPGSMLQYPTPVNTAVTWDGQGGLPGAFHAPWTFAATDFDPSFRVSYWNEAAGFSNVASAPWNQGMAAPAGSEIYADGLKYLGNYNYGTLMPVWTPSGGVAL